MKKTILIVDDEPDLLVLERARLEKAGYSVITATTGEEALALLEKVIPDLVLSDFNLSLINGSDLCKKIKADNALKHIPVILFTATFKEEILRIAKEAKADDFLAKPFDPEELLEKIEKFITKGKLVQRHAILSASYNRNEKQRLRL